MTLIEEHAIRAQSAQTVAFGINNRLQLVVANKENGRLSTSQVAQDIADWLFIVYGVRAVDS